MVCKKRFHWSFQKDHFSNNQKPVLSCRSKLWWPIAFPLHNLWLSKQVIEYRRQHFAAISRIYRVLEKSLSCHASWHKPLSLFLLIFLTYYTDHRSVHTVNCMRKLTSCFKRLIKIWTLWEDKCQTPHLLSLKVTFPSQQLLHTDFFCLIKSDETKKKCQEKVVNK